MLRRAVSSLVLVFATGAQPRADERATAIAKIHVEAVGGLERIEAVTALRITGRAETGEGRVSFTILAARPKRLRLETQFPDRVVVQGTDGAAPPWELNTARHPTAAPMSGEAAALFLADADFDDPLVRAVRDGDSVEFAGEASHAGRKVWRVLVARSLTENIFLLVDAETYLIAERGQRLRAGGRTLEIVSRFDDYRPVNGVLVAHVVEFFVNGARVQRAKFETARVEASVAAEAFAAPRK